MLVEDTHLKLIYSSVLLGLLMLLLWIMLFYESQLCQLMVDNAFIYFIFISLITVIANYLSSDFSGQTDIFFLPERFSIRYVSQGDAVALQPTLSFDYLFVVETGPSDPAIPPGVVFVYRRLRITIEDIDSEFVLSQFIVITLSLFYSIYYWP